MIAALCASILFLIAAWHVYWSLGGRFGHSMAIPQFADGRRVFEPSQRGTFAVAVLIAGAGLTSLVSGGLLPSPLPMELTHVFTLTMSAVFLVRALGWFRFVGFFKRVRSTPFAKFDTWVYCPLCLILGAGLAYVGLLP
jgi:hypothetical protein